MSNFVQPTSQKAPERTTWEILNNTLLLVGDIFQQIISGGEDATDGSSTSRRVCWYVVLFDCRREWGFHGSLLKLMPCEQKGFNLDHDRVGEHTYELWKRYSNSVPEKSCWQLCTINGYCSLDRLVKTRLPLVSSHRNSHEPSLAEGCRHHHKIQAEVCGRSRHSIVTARDVYRDGDVV